MEDGRIPDPELRLARFTRAQHGAFTRCQALEAGFSSSTIKRRVRAGRWLALHRGVYCEAALVPSLERDASAAVLAVGPAVASHRVAGRLWGLDLPGTGLLEVTVPGRAPCVPAGVEVHETSRLSPSEAARRNGIPQTSPARTLLDLAPVFDLRFLELGLDRFWRRGLVEPARLLTYLEDPWCLARRGSSDLRRLVRERLGEGPSGSDAETRLLQLIREAGLPLPVRQHPVTTAFGVRYLDLAYPDRKVAIELDGMESRLDPGVFADERVRQNLIQALGWTFRRFAYSQLQHKSLWIAFSLAEALGLRPARWR